MSYMTNSIACLCGAFLPYGHTMQMEALLWTFSPRHDDPAGTCSTNCASQG